MKLSIKMMTIAIVSCLTLAGCGTKEATKPNSSPETKKSTSKQATTTVTDQQIKDGTAKLLKSVKHIRKALKAGDDAKVKQLGATLEEQWGAFEDGVKPKYSDIYKQVEKNLDPLIAGIQASPLDKNAISKLNDQLITTLYDLSQKLISVGQVKEGAIQLIGVANGIQQALDAGNNAKVNELAPQLEAVWSTFEDGVKPRNANQYEKIEKFLNPEVAGGQNATIDKTVLKQLNEGLIRSLNELIQSLK